MEEVILVNEKDQELGYMEKLEAHQKGELHRAFSIFVFNSHGEMMLQRRAFEKYHSPGLWTNTCCSHQRKGESNLEAAKRRLQEEMGFECEMHNAFHFVYRSDFDNGLIEHELDHVIIGSFEGKPQLNAEEVAEWKWMHPADVARNIASNPDDYTVWFKICFDKVVEHRKKHQAA